MRHLNTGERTLDEDQIQREYTEATVVFVLWLTFLIIGVAVLLQTHSPAFPAEYVIFDVMSAQSNVGLDAGVVRPETPDVAKSILIANMWVGRLEIIPVAVLTGTIFGKFDLYR